MAKRRTPKRRISDAAELAAWSELFASGYDFFGDLEPFGFTRDDSDREARAAAREAWKRLGEAFMATRAALPGVASLWALDTFGRPWEARRAR